MDIRDGELRITDGTTRVNLNSTGATGFKLDEWRPLTNEMKGGGVWHDSPLADGRRLATYRLDSVTESLSLTLTAMDQDDLIRRLRQLRRLLTRAQGYWTQRWRSGPVWLEARGPREGVLRRAVIIAGRIRQDDEPYASRVVAQPFGHGVAIDLALEVTRETWRDEDPGSVTCVEVGNAVEESFEAFSAANLLQTWNAVNGWTANIAHKTFVAANGYLYLSARQAIFRDTTGLGSGYANTAGADDVYYGSYAECDDNSLLVAAMSTTVRRMYRSTDNGASWASVLSLAAGAATLAMPMIVKAPNGDVFALLMSNFGQPISLYKSTDNGATWSLMLTRNDLYVYANDLAQGATLTSGRLLFICRNSATFQICSLYSDDNGATWHTSFSPHYSGILYYMGIEEFDTHIALTHTAGMLRSVDGGLIWSGSETSPSPTIYGTYTLDGELYAICSDATIWHSPSGHVRNLAQLVDLDAYNGYALGETAAGAPLGFTLDTTPNPDQHRSYELDFDEITYTSGRAATCDEEVYATNHHLPWNVTHLVLYDSSAGTYTDIHPAAAFPLTLLPNPLGANDALMAACAGETSGTPFSSLVFDLAQALTATGGITLAWQYSTGAGTWGTLTTVDHTNGLMTAGVGSVHWQHPSDWAAATYNGVTAYWVRLVVTAVAGAVTLPQQQTRDVYTVATPYLDIDEAQVAGDLDALAQMLVRNVSSPGGPDAGEPALYENRLVIGRRNVERGADFTAYLNASDRFEHDGIAAYVGTQTTFATDARAVTGRAALYAPTATSGYLARVTWQLTPDLTPQFYGDYHAWALVRQDGGAAGDFSARLRVSTGSGGVEYLSNAASNAAVSPRWQALDLGQVAIPASGFLDEDDVGDETLLALEVSCDDYTGDLYIYGIVIIPVDEWAGDFIDLVNEAGSTVSNLRRLEVDSVTYAKRQTRAMVRTPGDQVAAVYEMVKNGPASLESQADQRLWLLALRRFASMGTHTGADNAAMLTDSAGAFLDEGVEVGWIVYNITDGSSGTITARTATTVTATLAGGVEDDWDTGDAYYITPSEVWVADCEICHTPLVNAQAQYLSMRGDS